jgi:hypothetical protein
MNGVVMKELFHNTLRIVPLSLLLVFLGSISAQAQGGRLELSQLDHLTAKASETVEVSIDERLIQLATKVFGKDEDDQKVKDIVSKLKGIYVRSFEFEAEGGYVSADIESIRTQLRTPEWVRVLNVTSKKEGNVEVYLRTTANVVEGLAVLVSDPKELTVVNIIGPVDLEKLSALEGQFGVPELGIESAKPKKN